jgi:uncharacterized membrane protein YqiK
MTLLLELALGAGALLSTLGLAAWLAGLRYIPHPMVGVVEKLWSSAGSLTGGRIIALHGEAGFQADLLRGGLHWGYVPWQYRVHKAPLVTIGQGKLGYVYARDGAALPPSQTLGRVVVRCEDLQDARAFLERGGQRGRQRAILREGVYAMNPALFVVITEQQVLVGPLQEDREKVEGWRKALLDLRGFDPVVIGRARVRREDGEEEVVLDDLIGVVTVHDGPPIESSEIIAPEVQADDGQRGHDCFQDPEAFLALKGHRGKQLQALTDGTFFLNRWFATVELRPKTVIPIGYVGVVVAYHGVAGEDVTGPTFRYGEQVDPGHRGVWKRALPPGKYPLNPYAMTVEHVPTVNFVLRWITGMTEEHQYDKDLRSIELITADGYEPTLPLSLVLHIDYEKAPRVVQRFGDVKRLISQTLDPILSAYFRDVAQTTNMLDLLTKREEIQARATEELGRRFKDYDINCIAVLIGRPEARQKNGDDPIDRLFDQLRQRRLADEQTETFGRQEVAARKRRDLAEAQAAAEKQTQLTQTAIDVQVAANRGEAELAEARRLAERDVVRAEGESRARELVGKGEAARIAECGRAEALVAQQKAQAFGDPRLLALQVVAQSLASSGQALVPERVVQLGPQEGGGLVGQLLSALTGRSAA